MYMSLVLTGVKQIYAQSDVRIKSSIDVSYIDSKPLNTQENRLLFRMQWTLYGEVDAENYQGIICSAVCQ